MNITPITSSPNFTPTTDSVYGILNEIAIQDINAVEHATHVQDVFASRTITSGSYAEDIIMEEAKDGTTFTPQDIEAMDATGKYPTFKQEIDDLTQCPKTSWINVYGQEDFRRWAVLGNTPEQIKALAVAALANKRDDEQNLAIVRAIMDTRKKVQASAIGANLVSYTAATASLKDCLYNIQQVVDTIRRNGNKSNTSGLMSHTPESRIKVFMSDEMLNKIKTYGLSGVYQLDEIVRKYEIVTMDNTALHFTQDAAGTSTSFNADGVRYGGASGKYDSIYNPAGIDNHLTASSNAISIDNRWTVYIMDIRHVRPYLCYQRAFSKIREGQDDVVSGLYVRQGVFTSGLYNAVVLDCSAWKDVVQ